MRSVPQTTSVAPGGLVTALLWNNGPKALNDWLSNRPTFRGRSNSNQNVANNAWTAIAYGINLLDTDGGHSLTVNNSRYVCQVAGWYWIRGTISWNPTGASNVAARIDTAVAKNGGIIVGSSQFLTKGSQVNSAQQASALVQLAVGDYVEIWTRQQTGATQIIDLGFGIECGFDALWIHS